MLAISPQRDSNGDEREAEVGNCLASTEEFCNEFMGDDFLLDIDFDELFAELDDGDVLPDLEVDPAEILAALSVPHEEEPGTAAAAVEVSGGDGQENAVLVDEIGVNHAEEVLSAREKADDLVATAPANSSFLEEADRGRKTSAKGSQRKRKVKVDWTPELHRRFVQVVEQLGIHKAVPSRILELMGTDGLTRHNVASHLQKYRSHRKHLLAWEEEAPRWSQRRYMYAGGDGGGGDGSKRDIINPWLLPTMGFPPPPLQPLRPLHVWGHPTVDQSHVHLWPKHLAPAPSPPPRPWDPQPPLPPPPTNPPYWHTNYLRGPGDGWLPIALTQGTPCFPQPPLTASFPAPPVPGIPPRPLYRPENVVPDHSSKLSSSLLSLDADPSKESIDAAIRDVLARPSLPLPLGLKTPSLDGVLNDSQRQGISKTASL